MNMLQVQCGAEVHQQSGFDHSLAWKNETKLEQALAKRNRDCYSGQVVAKRPVTRSNKNRAVRLRQKEYSGILDDGERSSLSKSVYGTVSSRLPEPKAYEVF
jgi:hypothetical protein